jgi:hypothetical protein
MTNPMVKDIKSLPLVVAWGIWLAQNHSLFEDSSSYPSQCVVQSLSIFSSFPQAISSSLFIPHENKHILKEHPWAFFDGVGQGQPTTRGEGGIISTNEVSSFSFVASLGLTTNNLRELMALKLTLLLAREKGINYLHIGINYLHIYGDYSLV